MAVINIYDRAEELRIEIRGDFSGTCVRDTSATWRTSLPEAMHRRFTVDISEVSSCDVAGRNLLREMYRHGTQIAAGNPAALGLLHEITSPSYSKAISISEKSPNRISMTRSLRVNVAAAS